MRPTSTVTQGSDTQFTSTVTLAREQPWLRITSPQFPKGASVVAGPFQSEGDRVRFVLRLNNRLDSINNDLGVTLTTNRLELTLEPFEQISKPEGARGTSMPNIESFIKSHYWSNSKNLDPSSFRSDDK